MRLTIFFILFLSMILPSSVRAGGINPFNINIGFYQSTSYAMRSSDFKIGMDVWIKQIASSKNFMTHAYFYKDPKKMAKDLRKGKLDLIVATPLVIVKYFDLSKLKPGVVGFKSSKTKSKHLYLLVHKGMEKKPLERLFSRPVLLPMLADNAQLYLKYRALKRGLPPPRFKLMKNTAQAILNLFFDKADMAVATQASFETACELNPQIKEKIAIYDQTDLFIGNFVYLRKDYDENASRNIIVNAMNIPKSPRGRQVMAMFQSDTIDLCKIEDLYPTLRLCKAYEELKTMQNGLSATVHYKTKKETVQ